VADARPTFAMSWAAFFIILDGEMGEEDWQFMAGIWFA
jgi:hypothetical protein